MAPRGRCLRNALVTAALLLAPALGAQQVTGRVTNQQTGEPLAAVQVFITGSGIGALTQQNGRYLLLNVPAGTHTVTAERIGYRSVSQQVTVAAGQTGVQDFALSEEALGLDEIIVTGTPGGTQRRAIGNSVLSVAAAEVTSTVAVASVQDLLSGRSPGISFIRTSGGVGTGSAIEVRGTGSFNLGIQPLIFVDGIRVNNDTQAGPILGSGKQVSVLDDFNPADIESIEIIKGPAAATLYGTEASAGVIQIITKRGSEGAPQFDVTVRNGTNYLRDPEGKLGTFWSCTNSFTPPCDEETGTLMSYNPYTEANLLVHQGAFPWESKDLFQNGMSQSYNVGVRGGTQAIRYFLSATFDRDEGIEYWSYDQAANVRANIGVVFSDAFSLDIAAGFMDGFTNFGAQAQSDGGIWDDLLWGSGYCLPRVNPTACPRLMGFQEHLPTDLARVSATRDSRRVTGSGQLNFTPAEWLSARAIFGADIGWDENTQLFPLEVQLPAVFFRTPNGKITLSRPVNENFSIDFSGTAKYAVNAALGTATSVGVQYYYKSASNFENTGIGFPSPLSTTINQTPVASSTIVYDFVENKSLGFYVQEQLSWNDRVFLTGAVRFDDNSAFGSALDPEIYPKLAATWTVSDESFWNLELINSLRLRGAWGQAGRQPNTFAGVTRYGVGEGPRGTSTLVPRGPGNPEVGPERSTELELGFDVAMLDNRLTAEFSWFNKQNKAALLSIPEPPSFGSAGNVQRNMGQIDNWGWELSLNSSLYQSDLIDVDLSVTGSHVDNEIVDLGTFPGTSAIKIGYPYPNYTRRFWITSGEYSANGAVSDGWGRKITGYCDPGVRLGDGPQYGLVRGGTPINCAQKDPETVLYGPGFFTYRLSANPSVTLFNNIRLHVLMDGAYGKKIQDGRDAGVRYNNSYESVTENDPTWVAADRYGTSQVWGFYSAGFWKLREAGVRYTLPESIVGRIGADRASLSISGRELGTIWREQDYNWSARMQDPDMANQDQAGSNYFILPPLTKLAAELRVTF